MKFLGHFLVTLLVLIGLLIILICVPIYLEDIEHATEFLQQQRDLTLVANMKTQRYTALKKFLRIAKNTNLTKKEWSDIVSTYSAQAYPNQTSFQLGISSIHSRWKTWNIAVQITMNIFLTNVRSMECSHSMCRLSIGFTTVLGAILLTLVLASMIEVYRATIRFIAEKISPGVVEHQQTGKTNMIFITRESVTLILTLFLSGAMFGLSVFMTLRENKWTTAQAIKYNLRIGSGIGFVDKLPSYLAYDQVTSGRALFVFSQFLWLTTSMCALFSAVLALLRSLVTGINSMEEIGQMRRAREKELNSRTRPRNVALYHT